MATPSRVTTAAKDEKVAKGIREELPAILSTSTVVLGTTVYTQQALADFFEQRVALANAIRSTHAAWIAAIKAYGDMNLKANVVLRDLRNVVVAAVGEDSPKMASFGFAPHKKAVLTVEQKQAAAQKAIATRKARRTMGKRQRAKIKGSVEQQQPAATALPTDGGVASEAK